MIDLSATVTRALELLAAQGMSDKSLHAYTHTGFGCIVRNFQAKGLFSVTPNMLDDFLCEQSDRWKQGNFSTWKWRLVRRSCELLKHCALEDSVDMPPLFPWSPILHRSWQSIEKSTPTAEQFADPGNIFALAWKTNRAMMEIGLTAATVRHYRTEGLSVILKRHYEEPTEHFSEGLLSQIITEKRSQYEQGQTPRTSYQNLRKAAHWLREMHLTGRITLGNIPNWGQQETIEPFKILLDVFCEEAERTMAESSFMVARSAVRRFLLEMEAHGFNALTDFSPTNVNRCITSFATHYTGGLGSSIYSVRLFLHFLHEHGLTAIDLSLSLPELVTTRKMFHEGFAEEELKRLLKHPDRTTAIGKRDYAMMVLAMQSGLRACDVVRLKLSNIDWRTREIRLTQHKTGEPLALPLEPESGNSIADYILNGRPNSVATNIFLCHTGAIRPLDARSASAIVSKHMKQAEIPARHRAFHALRRTLGTRLLQGKVSFELIQQILGHRNMDSLKPYLSIDEQGLKMCALPLVSQGKVGGSR